MTSNQLSIDRLLAAVLRGADHAWPRDPAAAFPAAEVNARIGYHGIAGLIADRGAQLADWPDAILGPVRQQAIALAMWELRHKELLGDVLGALAEAKIVALLLKGTAVAYDLYSTPATRARGDSDLLIAPQDLAATRAILTSLGYRCQPLDDAIADDLALQEVWGITCDKGTTHHLDLHWQLDRKSVV